MKFASVRVNGKESAAVVLGDRVITLKELNDNCGTRFPVSLFEVIEGGHLPGIEAVIPVLSDPEAIPLHEAGFCPPYRRPGKIWGIGLNYREHARDLGETAPAQPASFMKPSTAVIGSGDAIRLPEESKQVTAEAELGIIIGRVCRKVMRDDAHNYIFGYTAIIDVCALDILQQNPRYLTRAKSFDTFFSFGPIIVTPDEVSSVGELTVRTVINGGTVAENSISNMTFDPLELVYYHSRVMTLEPGDIISTGTPGAGTIHPGDVVRSEIDGFVTLENPVQADA